MGTQPVMGTGDPGSWRLAPSVAGDTQGIVASPFAHLPFGVALLLDASAAPGSAWLHALLTGDPAQACLQVTDATGKRTDGTGAAAGCAALAFTATGLAFLGLDRAVLDSFAQPFTEGMHTPNRRRRLGDTLLDPPARQAHPLWGGNAPVSDADAVVCEHTVHAAVLLYHETPDKLRDYAAPLRACLAAAGVSVAHELSLSLMLDSGTPPVSREHFGFADGISQPIPFGEAIVTDAGEPFPRHPVHGVAAGDLLLGHINAHGEPSPGPVVPATAANASLLPEADGAPGLASLGRNGSYLVMRELSQDVDAFWRSMARAARQLGHQDAAWVAERVVGWTKDGVVLAKTPPAPAKDGPANDFLFYDEDALGQHCPLGSHIRRSNPRDGLSPDAGSTATLLKAANNHRILRRGRKYASYDVPDAPALPGLLFMCLNTDLERQFEFVQQSWLMNPSFGTLFGEHDPLLGPAGPFTIPADPLRLRPDIATFVRLIGGEYFFLPSLPALRYLASLDSAP